MIEKFCKFKKATIACIFSNVFVTTIILFMSALTLSLGVIYKNIFGIILGTMMATVGLILIVFLVKDIIESVTDYKKAKLELIRILDKTLEGGKYND